MNDMRDHFLNYGAATVKLYDALETAKAEGIEKDLRIARLESTLNELRDELYRLQTQRELHIIERTAAQEQFATALDALTHAKRNVDEAIARDLEAQREEQERKRQLETQLRSPETVKHLASVAEKISEIQAKPDFDELAGQVEELGAALPSQADRFPQKESAA
jgi:chromosome segregation ATPase